MARKVQVELTEKQTSAFELLTDPDLDLHLLYGGAKGGGKSFLLCIWLKVWVEWLIQFFDLKPSQNPVALGFAGRKRGVDFKDTTLEDFKRVIPDDLYRLHDNEHEIIFHETAKIFVGGLDDPKRVEKFNSANYAFFAIDQAEETERPDIEVLKASLRLKINGKTPPYKRVYTANPSDCWLKEDFIDEKLPNHFFVPALYSDNPHLPTDYGDTLEGAFKNNAPLLDAYKYGNWYALQASNQLISAKMLDALKPVKHHFKEIRRIVSCDPSLGGDECSIKGIENYKVIDELNLHERDPMKIAGYMIAMAVKLKCPNLVTDCTGGLGEAINARIREQHPNWNVISLDMAENFKKEERIATKFFNKRAEVHWSVMRMVQDQKIPYVQSDELRRQAKAIRFKVINSDGVILIEPKSETKKLLGRSPDDWDAFSMGVFVLPGTDPIKLTEDAWADVEEVYEVGGGATSAMTA